jgi:hypothetical protein
MSRSIQRNVIWLGLPGLVAFLALCGDASGQVYNVNGQPQPLVVPISLNINDGSITLGDRTYSATGSAGVHIVRVQRAVSSSASIPAPVFVEENTFADARSVSSYLQGMKASGDIVLISAFGNFGFNDSEIAKDLEGFGATTEFENIGSPYPFSLIGNGGLNQAQAYQVGQDSLHGYLAQDSNSNYVFVQPDYVRYDLTTDGTIKVGSTTYAPVPQPYCAGGFNLVVLDHARLNDAAPVWRKTYCTNDGIPEDDSQGILGVAHDLGTFSSNEGTLVFLASWGKPTSPFFKNLGNTSVGLQVRQLGGYWETFSEMGVNDTYTLVGSAPPPNGIPGARNRGREASSLYPGYRTGEYQTGDLHGLLHRKRRGNWYSPTSSDPTGTANLDLYLYLAQSPTAFPHPATSGESSAFQAINSALCGSTSCNVRNYYWDTNQSLTSWTTALSGMNDPSNGQPCTKTSTSDFCIVHQQLLTEFGYVADIRQFNQNLTSLWAVSGSTNLLTLLDTFQRVQDEIQAPNDQTVSIVETVFNSFLSAAGAFVPAMGVIDAVFNFTTGLVTDLTGNSTASQNTAVENLEEQARTMFTAQGATTGTLFDLIYQDWGRLSAVGQALEQARPGWTWNSSTTTSQALSRLAPLVERSYYRSLMAAHFAIGRYTPDSNSDHLWAAPYYYTAAGSCFFTPCIVHPFNGYYPYTYRYDPDPYNAYGYTMLNAPTQNLLTDNGDWLGISATNTSQHDSPYGAPGFNTLTHLFQAPGDPLVPGYQTASLGVYRPEFFQGWGFPRVTCAGSAGNNNIFDFNAGCDWGSAAPPPEAFPNPVMRLKISVTSSPLTGGEAQLTMTLTNNGTVNLTNIDLEHISVRVAGGGTVTLTGQNIPLMVGNLAVGNFTQIRFNLKIPAGAKKVLIVESGTMQNEGTTAANFSQGQVVFPRAK